MTCPVAPCQPRQPKEGNVLRSSVPIHAACMRRASPTACSVPAPCLLCLSQPIPAACLFLGRVWRQGRPPARAPCAPPSPLPVQLLAIVPMGPARRAAAPLTTARALMRVPPLATRNRARESRTTAMSSSGGASPPVYLEGDTVLGYHGDMIYECKVRFSAGRIGRPRSHGCAATSRAPPPRTPADPEAPADGRRE